MTKKLFPLNTASLVTLICMLFAFVLMPAEGDGAPLVCDIDNDGVVDRTDVQIVSLARGQTASGPDDPRDIDGDGLITSGDARACVYLCSLPQCVDASLVPDLIGLEETAAEQQVLALGFAGSDIRHDYTALAPEGQVYSQEPAAGTPLALDSLVSYTISAGITPKQAIWLSVGNAVVRVTPVNGEIQSNLQTVLSVDDLVVDSRNNRLWALTPDMIYQWPLGTGLQPGLAVTQQNPTTLPRSALNASDGSIWTINGDTATGFDVDANPVASIPLVPGASKDIADGDAGTLFFTATDNAIQARDSMGAVRFSIDVSGSGTVRWIRYDSTAQRLWVDVNQSVSQYDGNGIWQFNVPSPVVVTQPIPDGAGGLWFASDNVLSYVTSSGSKYTYDLTAIGYIDTVTTITVDPSDGSAWVMSGSWLLHLDRNGALQDSLDLSSALSGQSVSAMAIYSDIYPPSLSFRVPPDGALLGESPVQTELDYTDKGLGVDTNSLSFALDGNPLNLDCVHTGGSVECALPVLVEGSYSLTATLSDLAGNIADPALSRFDLDLTPPVITLDALVDGFLTNQVSQTFAGDLNKAATLTLNGQSISLDAEYRFAHPVSLLEGVNNFILEATDAVGRVVQLQTTLTLDTVAPAALQPGQVTVIIDGNDLVIEPEGGGVEAGSEVAVTNARTGESVMAITDAQGHFSIRIAGQEGDALILSVRDAAGNSSADAEVIAGIPPDPVAIAPQLDSTIATSFTTATEFLYSGSNPIQRGVLPGTIVSERASVIRGLVSQRDGTPLAGVKISVKDHSEFGYTLSRVDGAFDLAVNGGGWLTIRYERDGYLPVQRQIKTPWQDYAWLPDVVMIPLDSEVTTVNLGSGMQMQAARGSSVTDVDGTRRATILFPQGLQASLVLGDGSTQSLNTMNVRATEYTVGDKGPASMPGELPPTSGYTYAVELSVDEATTAGAKEVRFDRPVAFYLENFLDFPVGGAVPVGWYDRERAAWIPSDNGRIVEVLSITGGMADLDVDGSGIPADAAALASLGITDAERVEVASLYSPGQSLWRVQVEHFTPWDCNWPYGPPDDAEAPEQPEPEDDEKEEEPCEQSGSIIECENQVLGERLPITGSKFTLNYRSDRVEGRSAAKSLNISLTGESIPASLQRVELEVLLAGKRFSQKFPATPNQSYQYIWDGNDAFGRKVQGIVNATVRIGYVYKAEYQKPSAFYRSFAIPGAGYFGRDRGAGEITVWQKTIRHISIFDARSFGFSGWALSGHQLYASGIDSAVLYRGDGTQKSTDSVGEIITTVAGNGVQGYSGDGLDATNVRLRFPEDVATSPDGDIYIADADNNRIRKVREDGVLSTVAGNGSTGYNGEDIPADEAGLNHPSGVAVGADNNIYIADTYNLRIRKVSPDGLITTLAGNGMQGMGGDGGLALDAQLDRPMDVATAADGSVYVADTYNHKIRRIDPDGVITTYGGTGMQGYSGDGGPALTAMLSFPYKIALDENGDLYIADRGNHRIRKIASNGIITTVAGNGAQGSSGNYENARTASLSNPSGVSVGPDGKIYLSDTGNHCIRRIEHDGVMTIVAGDCTPGYSGDGDVATDAELFYPGGIAIDPRGALYIADKDNGRIRLRHAPLTGLVEGEFVIPSRDGLELFVLNNEGRHLRTMNAYTNAITYQYQYDASGFLSSVVDANGNVTQIIRQAGGGLVAIIAPDGQRTDFTLDANGYLGAITNPAGEAHSMIYTEGGLLTSYTDPKGNISTYGYDNLGRLIESGNPAGGGWQISRNALRSGHDISLTSAENKTTHYTVERLNPGVRLRTNTLPDGTQASTLHNTNGRKVQTSQDGTVTKVFGVYAD